VVPETRNQLFDNISFCLAAKTGGKQAKDAQRDAASRGTASWRGMLIMSDFSLRSFVFGKDNKHMRADAQVDGFRDALQAKRPATAALGGNAHLSITTLMHRTQLWTVVAPAPVSVGTWASRTLHNFRAAGTSSSHQRPLAAHFRVWFSEPGQGPLHWRIGLDVVVRRSRTLMAEPECNHAECDTGLKPMHCWRGEVVLSGS
jgi:hypothetical protein